MDLHCHPVSSIHIPTINVKLRDGSVEVRELSWPDALCFYGKLKEQMQRLIGDKGEIKLDAQSIAAAIEENIGLGTWLVLTTTGKDEQWLVQRSLSEVLDVATEAAVLNIGIIAERIKNGRSRLAKALGGASPTPNSTELKSTSATPTSKSS